MKPKPEVKPSEPAADNSTRQPTPVIVSGRTSIVQHSSRSNETEGAEVSIVLPLPVFKQRASMSNIQRTTASETTTEPATIECAQRPSIAQKFSFTQQAQSALADSIIGAPSGRASLRLSVKQRLSISDQVPATSTDAPMLGPVFTLVVAFCILLVQSFRINLKVVMPDMVRTLTVLSGITYAIVVVGLPTTYLMMAAQWDDEYLYPFLRVALWICANVTISSGVVAMHVAAVGWTRTKPEVCGVVSLSAIYATVLLLMVAWRGAWICNNQIDALLMSVFAVLTSVYCGMVLNRNNSNTQQVRETAAPAANRANGPCQC